ncbi:MAG: ribosome biogenesis/translation initiation ATPase RLI [Thermoplasmata archaeon]|jgi:ATP-binding cassette subfamily E protein 1|nr:ribosome biogenesis/translation initiation ATPase RLI [Thermoplasmata archaeon]
MRIAVLLKDRCQPKRCSLECIRYCPPVRTGVEAIAMGDRSKPVIAEELCVGCGICVHKCPFEAIKIIGLPHELEGELVHQFGKNSFRLYGVPVPKKGQVTGLLGPNGIGKTTAISILSGQFVPNLGDYEKPGEWGKVLDKYAGREIRDYFVALSEGKLRTAMKPQYVDKLPALHKGAVKELLKKVDDGRRISEVASRLGVSGVLERDISKLSGGELQRVALAATLLKDADVYFFDEPSSYLDIYQRLEVAKVIQELSEHKQVVVIEHDLAVMDFLADLVHIMYGSEGAYGVMSQPRPVRTAINVYLEGYLREENIRFRDTHIVFEKRPPRTDWQSEVLIQFPLLTKRFKTFTLKVHEGSIKKGEVVGAVGPNATGKTTFVKILAGEIEPSTGDLKSQVSVSYKPQYIKPEFEGTVREMLSSSIGKDFESGFFQAEVAHPLALKYLMEKDINTLSGGELQRVSIAECLGKTADIYLLDEPSAYLDSNQRMIASKTIRRVIEKVGRSAFVVDHDVYMIDLISDSLMVFSGEPSAKGDAVGPLPMRDGMNQFLKEVEITFRRDADSGRPRINKKNSRLDREQKSKGEYYYG